MMSLKLIKLTKTYEKQLGEMIDEWKADQALNHTNHSPWAIFKNDYHDFDYYLENLEVKEAADGKVPDSVFFLLAFCWIRNGTGFLERSISVIT